MKRTSDKLWVVKAACATAFLFLAALATAQLAILRWEL
jgi:hypothetical protein